MLRDLPKWSRQVIYNCGGVAAATIQLGSSWSLGSLAHFAGLGMPRLLLLPVSLDMGAIVAATLWVAGHGRLRTTGMWATIGLVGGSISFNAADALAAHGKLAPDQLLWISVAIAMIFPLTAALMGHIVLLVREASSAVAADRVRQATEREEAERQRAAELAEKLAAAAARVQASTVKAEEKEVRKSGENPLIAQLPGSNKGEKLEAYIEQQWSLGLEKPATHYEKDLYGTDTGYARRATKVLKGRGVVPPSERRNGHKLSLAK